jgi:hypothetical protein
VNLTIFLLVHLVFDFIILFFIEKVGSDPPSNITFLATNEIILGRK